MAFERLQFIAERTLIGSGRERLYAIALPEVPGALKSLCREVVNGHSITEFSYRLQNHKQAHVLVGLTIDSNTAGAFAKDLQTHDYAFHDLTDDDLAKEHLRHMVGGSSPEATSEGIFSIELPERPGALADMLDLLGDEHNISLFHYRSLGGDVGRVLVGFEQADAAVESVLKQYRSQRVNDNVGVQVFLTA
jgi:threonine dehydratase